MDIKIALIILINALIKVLIIIAVLAGIIMSKVKVLKSSFVIISAIMTVDKFVFCKKT